MLPVCYQKVQSFHVDKYPVTMAQYADYLNVWSFVGRLIWDFPPFVP